MQNVLCKLTWLTSVRNVAIGGSAPTAALMRRVEHQLGATVRQIWGMTETSPMGVINTALPAHAAEDEDAAYARKLKQGRGLWGVELRIMGDDGTVQPRDGVSVGVSVGVGVLVAVLVGVDVFVGVFVGA